MRKRYRVLFLAGLVVALVVPVGFALSLESPSAVAPAGVIATASSSLMASAATRPAETSAFRPLSDAAKLLLLGTMLFGLAAFVRKAT